MTRSRPPRARSSRWAALLVPALAAACGETDTVAPPEAGPASIAILTGADQRGVPGRPPAEAITVRVLDAEGRPAGGSTVTFRPEPGHGSTDPASAVADAGGEAATSWTLGATPGPQRLQVSAGRAGATVRAEAIDLEAELDALFAPASAAEVEAVRADWARRDISAAGVAVELTEELAFGETAATLRIVSHVVAGARHFGAIIVPDGAAPGTLPLLMFSHGGDGGVSVGAIDIVVLALGERSRRFVYAIPSFRSEPLRYGDRSWVSEGPSSHWDHDVDDALALANVVFETTPEVRPDAIHIVGGSRGAGVALLAGARDERVERIAAFYGPTDFFDDWIRVIAWKTALDGPWDLPGLIHLDSTVVQPLVRGTLSTAGARLELVRRSSVLFAADLPAVQVHHGTADFVVPVSQAESLMRTMAALGRTAPDFEAFIYEGGGHDFLSLAGAIPRAAEFIAEALQPKGNP
ncbi:MAG: hypothetical protein F4164_08075 [Gemmatimonadales bacterium]|nr:hypothetical protein [Gemmatimonadales bacterium]MYG49313.1 hypothetical protein [Gemmatimonadales bacterium]MYK01068.1 hypothetical protein [Candidatus Palauibacter ramosifaciens]